SDTFSLLAMTLELSFLDLLVSLLLLCHPLASFASLVTPCTQATTSGRRSSRGPQDTPHREREEKRQAASNRRRRSPFRRFRVPWRKQERSNRDSRCLLSEEVTFPGKLQEHASQSLIPPLLGRPDDNALSHVEVACAAGLSRCVIVHVKNRAAFGVLVHPVELEWTVVQNRYRWQIERATEDAEPIGVPPSTGARVVDVEEHNALIVDAVGQILDLATIDFTVKNNPRDHLQGRLEVVLLRHAIPNRVATEPGTRPAVELVIQEDPPTVRTMNLLGDDNSLAILEEPLVLAESKDVVVRNNTALRKADVLTSDLAAQLVAGARFVLLNAQKLLNIHAFVDFLPV